MATTATTEELTWTLIKIGLVSTAIGTVAGLYLIPRFKPWVSAAALTTISYYIKVRMLPHE